MGKALIKGTLAGGIVVFLWGMISWMALPWHLGTFSTFTNPDEVAQTIRENAPTHGIYLYPGMDMNNPDQEAKMAAGPCVFSVINPQGMKASDMGGMMVGSFLIQAAAALLITWLLLQAKGLSYFGKVGFVTLIGLTAGILGHLPYWNWWGFTTGYTMLAILDLVIGWFLAGLVIAKVATTN